MAGATLEGFVTADDGGRSVLFLLRDLPIDPCLSLADGAARFDGEVLGDDESSPGGLQPATILTPAGCAPPQIQLSMEGGAGDGELVIDSGGDVARYIGDGLRTTQGLNVIDGGDGEASSLLTFAFALVADVVAVEARFDGPAGPQPELFATVQGDTIVVRIPEGAPPGPQRVKVTVEFDIETAVCEGFATCTVHERHTETVDIIVR